jgi:uncharacterized membrane protein
MYSASFHSRVIEGTWFCRHWFLVSKHVLHIPFYVFRIVDVLEHILCVKFASKVLIPLTGISLLVIAGFKVSKARILESFAFKCLGMRIF